MPMIFMIATAIAFVRPTFGQSSSVEVRWYLRGYPGCNTDVGSWE